MAIYKTNYDLPFGQTDNPYEIAEDEEIKKKWKNRVNTAAGVLYTGTSNPIVDTDGDTKESDIEQDETITGETGTDTGETLAADDTAPETGEEEDPEAGYWKQIEELFKSGSVSEQYKAAIMAAIKAQELTTQQAVKQLEYEKEKADKARVKANREADLTFSRAINSTGKINQNIRSAGLAGSGWQETSQVGLTNAYQNALNTNSSDYNTAVKELNLAISQAKMSGDIATMQAIQTYAIQLAQQLYQEARDAVADRQWELSYALQKAAFDLEHAAQTGNNSGYIDSGSPYYTGKNRSEPSEDEVDPAASASTAMVVDGKIQDLKRSGLMGDDFRFYAALLLSDYVDKLTDDDLDTLASSCGLDPNEI